jgi:fido (protein-threonine AMPylation protein)
VASGLIEFQQFIYRNSRTHILQHGDLKTWHGKIFRDSVPIPYYAGNYRSDNPQRPCLRRDVAIGGQNGAPFAQVPEFMRQWSNEFHTRIVKTDDYVGSNPSPTNRARAVLQLAALSAGKFLGIHPFLNCNGRTSRLITNYVLHRYDYPMPYYNPYPRPGAPYAQATAASMVGNYTPMFQYLLGLLATASVH